MLSIFFIIPVEMMRIFSCTHHLRRGQSQLKPPALSLVSGYIAAKRTVQTPGCVVAELVQHAGRRTRMRLRETAHSVSLWLSVSIVRLHRFDFDLRKQSQEHLHQCMFYVYMLIYLIYDMVVFCVCVVVRVCVCAEVPG